MKLRSEIVSKMIVSKINYQVCLCNQSFDYPLITIDNFSQLLMILIIN